MISLKHLLVAAVLSLPSLVMATPITYEGALTSGVPVNGTVSSNGWINNIASGVDFWSFTGNAGDTIILDGDRTNGALDLAMSLYFGFGGTEENFNQTASFDGLTFITSADDNQSPNLPGPFGDPFIMIVLGQSGTFTVAIGGFASGASTAPYTYQLSYVRRAVPEPISLGLVVLGLAALGNARRQRAKA